MKAALERKKYYLMDNMAAFLLYYAPGNVVPQSASRRIDMLVEVVFSEHAGANAAHVFTC